MAKRRDIYEGGDGGREAGGADEYGNPPSGYIPGQPDSFVDAFGGLGEAGHLSESPRERQAVQRNTEVQPARSPEGPAGPGGAPPITSTPRQPSVPTPAPDGSTFQAGPPDVGMMQGLMPFQPMSGPSPVDMASPRLRGLYGNQGGLSGGGLGVPGATSPAANDPIKLLLSLLQG